MSSITDYHQYLFLGKITNSLSEEEHNELQELFSKNPAAEQAYKELLSKLPANKVDTSFKELNIPGFWKNVPGEIHQEIAKTKHKRIIKIIGVAVILVGFGLASNLLYNNNQRVKDTHTVTSKKSESIELKLANGKKIDLSATKGNIIQSDLILENKDNSLSYRAVNKTQGINTITVPAGMDYHIVLSDGSEVWLNSMTSLSFPSEFNPDNREIELEGEAYLSIAKNASKPFFVRISGSTIQVTGTEFNVNTYNKNLISVSLINGGINLVSASSTVKIKPGAQAVVANGTVSMESFDTQKILSWRKGLFYFEKANLEDLSQVLSRWFGITTQIDHPSLKLKRFAGVLDKSKPLNSFLDNLKAISKIESHFDKNGILHFK